MKADELAQFKNRLERRRTQLLDTFEDARAALDFLEISRPAEFYEEAQEEALSLGLKATEEGSWKELWAVERALASIESGTYGICEACGVRIARKRLEAVPMARYCVECQKASEKT